MEQLYVKLENCYGIRRIEHEFDFTGKANKVYAVYAPNGVMKTSFSKTFAMLGKGETPIEERYNRTPAYKVEIDGNSISKDEIYVLQAEIDITADSSSITDILVDPSKKKKYDTLLIDLDKQKNKLVSSLQKNSKIKKTDIEKKILQDWDEKDFPALIEKLLSMNASEDFEHYDYGTIFDPKVEAVLESKEFLSNAKEFTDKYDELFNRAGVIYKKGAFNPIGAEVTFSTLDKYGFFKGGHKVHLNGQTMSFDRDQLEHKMQEIHAEIDGNVELKKIQKNLAKNAQTQAFVELIETLKPFQVDFLIESLKPENQSEFRKKLWIYYISSCAEAASFVKAYKENRDEIEAIESDAAQAVPRWTRAVELFNDRFVDMPFTLSVANQTQAALGKEAAKLKFTFKDGSDTVEWLRSEVKTLSQGEKRALYLLNFIFDVEARKLANQKTLFIIDDVADSFDYKNKHAIVQYLGDLTKTDIFFQIILTHNYDFFRSIALNFIHRNRCLMTSRDSSEISLIKAEGINNYFIGMWKNRVLESEIILCATIPFTRNLIEYIKGDSDTDYESLTKLLHWKSDTSQITVGQYYDIYNRLFRTSHDTTSTQKVIDLIFDKANEVCQRTAHHGLNLEDKVLLSMASRLKAEMFMIKQLRVLKGEPSYWCSEKNQFGYLIKEYSSLAGSTPSLRVLEKVSVTVSSNIHLNSFMYEPILDLTIDHLISLYTDVCTL